MGMPPLMLGDAAADAWGAAAYEYIFRIARSPFRRPRSRLIHNNPFLWYHSQEFIEL
jgi:hypothetical protein